MEGREKTGEEEINPFIAGESSGEGRDSLLRVEPGDTSHDPLVCPPQTNTPVLRLCVTRNTFRNTLPNYLPHRKLDRNTLHILKLSESISLSLSLSFPNLRPSASDIRPHSFSRAPGYHPSFRLFSLRGT